MGNLAENTKRAYAADWADFSRWCRLNGRAALPPNPDTVAAYLKTLDTAPTTLRRRLAGLRWSYAQRGMTLDSTAPEIAAILAQPRKHPPTPRNRSFTDAEITAMIATLPYDLRGLRDRAILALMHETALKRSEIAALQIAPTEAPARLNPSAKRYSVTVTRKSGVVSCALHRSAEALSKWLHYAKLTEGPVFRAVSRDGTRPLDGQMNDKHIRRLILETVSNAGIRD